MAFVVADLSDGVLIADRCGEGVAGFEDEAGGPGVGLAEDPGRSSATEPTDEVVGPTPVFCTSCPGRKAASAFFTEGS